MSNTITSASGRQLTVELDDNGDVLILVYDAPVGEGELLKSMGMTRDEWVTFTTSEAPATVRAESNSVIGIQADVNGGITVVLSDGPAWFPGGVTLVHATAEQWAEFTGTAL